jgi:probable HAF family extracellular repeat protein
MDANRHCARWFASVLLCCALGAPAFAQAPTTYRFSDLGWLGGSQSFANDLNNLGEVVGHIYVRGQYHAAFWQSRGVTFAAFDLGPGIAEGISDHTVLVGQRANANARAWIGGAPVDMVGFPGSLASVGFAINNAGQVAGYSYLPNFTFTHAALWPAVGSAPMDLGALGGISSVARDINNRGDVVGSWTKGVTDTENSSSHAALWRDGAASDLSFPGEANSTAIGINDEGVIVGASNSITNGNSRATVWEGSSVSFLDQLGANASFAMDINNHGQIVGATGSLYSDAERATLWEGGEAIDLNSRLRPGTVEAGWVLKRANAINDQGWIVGEASNSKLGITTRAFLLSISDLPDVPPIPEPQTYALMLFGVALLAVRCTWQSRSAARRDLTART